MSRLGKSSPGIKKNINQYSLADVLLGNLSPDDANISFGEKDKYILTLISLTYTGTDYQTEDAETEAAYELLSYIIDKSTQTLDLKMLATNIKGNLCYIFVLPNNSDVIKLQLLMENAMKSVSIAFSNFNFNSIFSTSNSHSEAYELPDAYREALDMLAHAQRGGAKGLYYYMDVKEEHMTDYFYPSEKESCIIKFLKAGDFVNINREFDEIYSKNFDNVFASLEMVRCLYIDIFATIIKTCKSGIDGELYLEIDTSATMRILLNSTDISVMTDTLLELFERCCNEINLRRSGAEDAFLMDVERYIKKNYSTLDLNVTSIAEAFDVHPNYLSKVFKKQIHINLLTYINNVRIERAKHLLSHTSYTLEEICTKTGFGSYRTFVRVFHQIVSVSPGRYRNLTAPHYYK